MTDVRISGSAWGQKAIVGIAVLGFLGHFWAYWWPEPFFVEDAGISFAFVRNIAMGHGVVAWPGGERVEGFSNPLWTGFLVFTTWMGASPFVASKVLGAVFGALCLPCCWALARRAIGEGRDAWASVMAPLMLAASPQFVVWAACGLENALFCLLLVAGFLRLVIERGETRRPWSALLFAGLALCRPEGILYGGLAAGWIWLHGPGGWRRRLAWTALLVALPGCYLVWRIGYFGWPFPNTYYAKLGSQGHFLPWSWNAGGWAYLLDYLVQHGLVWALPLVVAGLVGLGRARGIALTAGLVGAVAAVFLTDGVSLEAVA